MPFFKRWNLLALKLFVKDLQDDVPGSIIGVLLWLLASWGFSLYVNNFGNYDATYGSLGGIIVLLMWMWISAQMLLIGAEVNSIIEHESPEGKREGAKSLADTGTSPRSSDTAVSGMSSASISPKIASSAARSIT